LKIRGAIRESSCTTGVNDTSGKIAAGINDAGGKFATGVVDTGGNLPPVSLTSVVHLDSSPVANNGNNIRLQTA
jgi:hypothetical protein